MAGPALLRTQGYTCIFRDFFERDFREITDHNVVTLPSGNIATLGGYDYAREIYMSETRVPILVSDGVDFERSGVEREWRDPLHSAHSAHIFLYPLSLSAPLQPLKTTLEWILSGWSGF